MKESRYFSLYLPEYKDDIDISEISDNFNRLDSGLEAMLIKKDITTNTINDIAVFPPFWSVKNPHDFDVVIYDRTFEKEITVEAGKTYKAQVDHGTKLNIHVQGLHELEFTYYISTEQAIEAAKGSDYKLTQITSEEFSASYKLQVKPKGSEEYIDVPASAVINIPKDKVVKSGDVKTCQTDGVPEGFKKGDKYIDLVIDNDEGSHIYIPVNALVDNKAEGISYSNTTSKMKATNVQSAIDEVAETVFKQTEIVPVSSVANTVTVPSDIVGDFAAVKMIGGKTVKSKNLITYPYMVSGTIENNDCKFTINDDGTIDIAAKRVTTADVRQALRSSGNRIPLKPNTTYVANTFNELATENAAFIFLELVPSIDSGTRTRAIDVQGQRTEFTTTSEELYANVILKVNKGTSAFDTLRIYPALYEKSEEIDYFEPYFKGLHSAPVEKIVAYTNDNHLNYGKGYNNQSNPYGFVNNALRCTSDELLAPISGFLNVSVLHPTKTMQLTIVELTDDRKVVKDSLWQPSNIVNNYALQSNTKYLRIVVRYSDNTTIALDDAIVFKVNTGVNETITSLSDIVKNLPDYGCSINGLYNYIDFERGVYVHNVGIHNMGELEWTFRSSDSLLYTSKEYNIAKVSKADIADVINSVYKVVSHNGQSDKTLALTDISAVTNAALAVRDSDFTLSKYSTAAEVISAFAEYLKDEYITFELANKEEIPLSDILAPFAVEPNGTIEFVNEHNLDVPNAVLYKKEVL